MEKKLYCVAFTTRDDWENPTIYHVRAEDRYTAIEEAGKKMGYDSINEIDEMVEKGDFDYLAIEVDDIIET
jgi:hypothetical protein